MILMGVSKFHCRGYLLGSYSPSSILVSLIKYTCIYHINSGHQVILFFADREEEEEDDEDDKYSKLKGKQFLAIVYVNG